MRPFDGNHALRLLGILCSVTGLLGWGVVAWKAASNLDALTPEKEGGERLMVWGLAGTMLMIVGTILLHLASGRPEGGEPGERVPPA